jgi:microcystin-dependent protein
MAKIKQTFLESVRAVLFGTTLLIAVAGGITWFSSQPTRAQLGGIQTWLGTAGGTANVITVSVHNIAALGDVLGTSLRFLPASTNTGPTTITINLDGGGTLGPVTVDRPTSNLGLQGTSGNDFIAGQIAEVMYDGTVFEIKHSIDMTPIGKTVEFRGTTAPAGSLVEDGSCYSQTTYVALFSVIGTTYNAGAPVGCSGGQFAVPYSNGTAFNAIDTQGAHTASRITSATCSTPGTVGALCGGQTQTLTLAQLPTGITGTTGAISPSVVGWGGTYLGVNSGGSGAFAFNTGSGSTTQYTSFPFTSNNTSGTAHPILNTTLLGIRAIKY